MTWGQETSFSVEVVCRDAEMVDALRSQIGTVSDKRCFGWAKGKLAIVSITHQERNDGRISVVLTIDRAPHANLRTGDWFFVEALCVTDPRARRTWASRAMTLLEQEMIWDQEMIRIMNAYPWCFRPNWDKSADVPTWAP